MTWICVADTVEVPQTLAEADAEGWQRILEAILPQIAPVWALDRRCQGDEVCTVYLERDHVVAVYCQQGQCEVAVRGPIRNCSR